MQSLTCNCTSDLKASKQELLGGPCPLSRGALRLEKVMLVLRTMEFFAGSP